MHKNINKILLALVSCVACTTLSAAANYTDTTTVPVRVMDPTHRVNNFDKAELIKLVKTNIDLDANKILNVAIQPVFTGKRITSAYVYLSDKKQYKFTTTKITLDQQNHSNYQLVSIDPNYRMSKSEKSNLNKANFEPNPPCPDPDADFVVASDLYTQIPSVKSALDDVAQKATEKGYHVVKLYELNATARNYEKYLDCPQMKGFFSIGHGSPDGILVDDEMLTSDFFDSMNHLMRKQTVVEFNSCEVFNDPLKSSVINGAQARKYVGGKTTLWIGTSEPASACFWDKALNHKDLKKSLNQCVADHDPTDTYGIGGHGKDRLLTPED